MIKGAENQEKYDSIDYFKSSEERGRGFPSGCLKRVAFRVGLPLR
jgi:hypothetical protein